MRWSGQRWRWKAQISALQLRPAKASSGGRRSKAIIWLIEQMKLRSRGLSAGPTSDWLARSTITNRKNKFPVQPSEPGRQGRFVCVLLCFLGSFHMHVKLPKTREHLICSAMAHLHWLSTQHLGQIWWPLLPDHCYYWSDLSCIVEAPYPGNSTQMPYWLNSAQLRTLLPVMRCRPLLEGWSFRT